MDALFRAGLTLSLIDRMTRPLARAQEQLSETQARAQELSERLDNIGQGMSQAGQSMAMAGGAMTAAFAAPIKFAADFQDSLTDLEKTTGFSDQGLQKFGNTLTELSEKTSIAATDLAQLAATGGQMGVADEKLEGFTKSMAKMSVAFDMPAQKTADQMAKISNAFDRPIDKAGTLGDAINHLSENTGANVSQTLDVISRKMGQLASTLGISAQKSAAMGATLIDQNIAADRASTALKIFMSRLNTIDSQSKKVKAAFSELGFSTQNFATRMQNEPMAAMKDFLERAKETGRTSSYMSRILGEEAGPAIASLAEKNEKLNKFLGMVNDKTNYAGSVQQEYLIKIGTLSSQLGRLWETTKNIGIALGTIFIPPITAATKAITAILSPINNFIRQHQVLAGVIFGTVGALGVFTLVAGGVLMMLGFMAQGLSGILALQGQGIFSGMLGPLSALKTRMVSAVSTTWSWVAAQSSAATRSWIFRENLSTLISSMWKWIAAQVRAIWTSSAMSVSLSTLARTAGASMVKGITRAVKAVWAFNTALVANPITWVVAIMAGAAIAIYKYWDRVRAFFGGFFKGLAQGLAPLMPLFQGLWSVVKLVLYPIGKLVSWLSDLVAPANATQKELSGFAYAGRLVGNVISWLFAPITGLIRLVNNLGLVWSGIKSLASSAMSGLVQAITNPMDTLKSVFLNFTPAGWLLQALNKASQRLLGFSLFDAGQKILNTLWKGMKSLASKPVQMVQNVAQKIRDFLPFSPAKMGPLADIHKTGGALMQTMAAGIQPDPVARKMKGALDSAKKAVPAAAMGASLAVTPVMAGGMPQVQDATAKAQYMAETPAPPRIPDLSATARWQPQLEGMPRMQDATAKMQTVTEMVTPKEYPEITDPRRREPSGSGAVHIGSITVDNSRQITAAPGDTDEIERILNESDRDFEESVYEAVVRALERRRRGDFGG